MKKKAGRPKGSFGKPQLQEKTESLTVRLDPKMRFLLDFLARARGQTITKVIERAVREFAARPENRLEPACSVFFAVPNVTWEDYWDPHEGVRTIALVTLGGVELSTREEELREFVLGHRQFFFEVVEDVDKDGTLLAAVPQFDAERIVVLWPRIEEYLALWESTRATDRYAAGHAMKEAIENAGVSAPAWPPPLFATRNSKRHAKKTTGKDRR